MCREAEELAKIPYEEDMKLCDYLILYLQKYSAEGDNNKDNKEEVEEASVSAAVSAAEESSGMKLLKRDLDDFTGDIQAAKKRGKKKGGANLKKKDTIAHGVDTIDFFALLEITPPATISAVPAAIETLLAKKKSFEGLERGAVPSISDKVKAANKQQQAQNSKDSAVSNTTGKQNKKSGGGFNLEADFPSLGLNGTKANNVKENGEASTSA